METIVKINPDLIKVNSNNPRTRIENVDDLVSSIKEIGKLIQPITVRKSEDGEGYEVVAGSRRLTAVKQLGWSEIDCIVLDIDEDSAFAIATAENVVRENMTAVDEANAVSKLYAQGKSKYEIASMFGKSIRWAEGRRKIVELGREAMEALAGGKINLGHAEVLTMCAPERVERYLDFAKWNSPEQLKSKILSDRKDLEDAPFNAKSICKNCKDRSDNQQDIFGDIKDCYCLNEECYAKQIAKECERQEKNFTSAGYEEVPEDEIDAAKYATKWNSKYHNWENYFSINADDEESKRMILKIKNNGHKARWYIDRATAENGLVWRVADGKTETEEAEEAEAKEDEKNKKIFDNKCREKANELEREKVKEVIDKALSAIEDSAIAIIFDYINKSEYEEEKFSISAEVEDDDEEESEEYNEGAVANVGAMTESGKTQREFISERIVSQFFGYNGCEYKSEEERNFFGLEERKSYNHKAVAYVYKNYDELVLGIKNEEETDA